MPWCAGISTAKLCRSSTVATGVPVNMSDTAEPPAGPPSAPRVSPCSEPPSSTRIVTGDSGTGKAAGPWDDHAGGLAGTRFSLTAPSGDTVRVPKFYSDTMCNTQLPIACCQ